MSGDPARAVNDAVRAMIDEMQVLSMGTKPYFKLSVVIFGSAATVVCQAQSEHAIDVTRITSLSGGSGSTNAAAALEEARLVLQADGGKVTDFIPYVFFMSDGAPDNATEARNAANALKQLVIPAGTPHLVTIGFGSVNDALMADLASTPELYKKLSSHRDVVKLFPNIGTIASIVPGGGANAVDQAIMDL
jgi:uncharacterized protein YegL